MEMKYTLLLTLCILGLEIREAAPVPALSLRRVRDIGIISSQRIILTRDGRQIGLEQRRFPDGEYYIRFLNPEAVRGADIILSSPLNSADDFMQILLTLGALNQYGAGKISLTLECWVPSTREDYLLLSLLRIFSQEISVQDPRTEKISSLYISPFAEYPKIEGSLHIDRIVYLQPRFKQTAEQAVGRIKDAEASFLEVKPASPGHWRVSLPKDLAEENIVLVHSTENAENLLALLLTLSSLREARVKSISLINTYQGYARQDKEFEAGEGVSAYTVLEALNYFLDRNFSLNVHYGKTSGEAVIAPQIWVNDSAGNPQTINLLKPQKVYNLNGFVQLAEGLMKLIHDREGEAALREAPLLLVSPDDGSFSYVQEAARVLSERYGIEVVTGFLNKERLSPTEVTITGPILGEGGKALELSPEELHNYTIFMLDDEISLGTTMKAGIYHLVRELGADYGKIYSGVVHGKFAEGVNEFFQIQRKQMLPQVVIALDSLPLPEGIVSASSAYLISFCIKRILGENVTVLMP